MIFKQTLLQNKKNIILATLLISLTGISMCLMSKKCPLKRLFMKKKSTKNIFSSTQITDQILSTQQEDVVKVFQTHNSFCTKKIDENDRMNTSAVLDKLAKNDKTLTKEERQTLAKIKFCRRNAFKHMAKQDIRIFISATKQLTPSSVAKIYLTK